MQEASCRPRLKCRRQLKLSGTFLVEAVSSIRVPGWSREELGHLQGDYWLLDWWPVCPGEAGDQHVPSPTSNYILFLAVDHAMIVPGCPPK